MAHSTRQGVAMMLFSSLCFAAVNLMVKYLPHLPATEIVLARAIITLIMSITVLRWRKIPMWGKQKNWLLVRGIAGTTALTLYFYTLQKLPMSAAITIQYLSPFFAAFMAGILLQERTRRAQWLFFAISFGGIAIMKGGSPDLPAGLVALGLISSMLSGLAYTTIRKLKDENPLVVVMYFPLVAAPVMIVFSLFNWVTPVGWDWALLLGIGVMTQLAQVYMTRAYQATEVNVVAPIKYIGVGFAVLWDIWLFGFIPTPLMFAGIALVILGIIANIWFKRRYPA